LGAKIAIGGKTVEKTNPISLVHHFYPSSSAGVTSTGKVPGIDTFIAYPNIQFALFETIAIEKTTISDPVFLPNVEIERCGLGIITPDHRNAITSTCINFCPIFPTTATHFWGSPDIEIARIQNPLSPVAGFFSSKVDIIFKTDPLTEGITTESGTRTKTI
jgi:hypothetical protein